jgi:hypothetical protein
MPSECRRLQRAQPFERRYPASSPRRWIKRTTRSQGWVWQVSIQRFLSGDVRSHARTCLSGSVFALGPVQTCPPNSTRSAGDMNDAGTCLPLVSDDAGQAHQMLESGVCCPQLASTNARRVCPPHVRQLTVRVVVHSHPLHNNAFEGDA